MIPTDTVWESSETEPESTFLTVNSNSGFFLDYKHLAVRMYRHFF